MEISPRIGSRFFWRFKAWTINELRLEHGKLPVTADDGDVTALDIGRFREYVSSGDIQRIAVARDGHEHVVASDWRDQESERAREEREKREAILSIEEQALRSGETLTKCVGKIRALCEEKKWEFPCERTRRNWRRHARGHESMLSPQWFRCGNRRQGPDKLLLDAMEEVAAAALLRNDRFELQGAWELVEALYAKKCRDAQQQPRRFSIRQFKNYLRRIDWAEQMRSRLDARTYRALTRSAVKLHTADLLWERVEMDASWLDVQIRNDKGEQIGRPILYAAIDVASGYPVGLELTIQKPSVLPFLDCLRFMYFPKPDLDKKYEIKNRIEVFGKPIAGAVDNGSEFIGVIATEIVRVLFGDSVRCKPYTPQEKPHVERFFGIVRAYVKTLPGSTISAVTTDLRNIPKTEQLLTLEDLKGRLLRFIYDEYALLPNELRSFRWRKAMSALDLVKEMKKCQMEPFPVSRDEFEHAIHFKKDSRTLNHDGISFDGFMYHSDDLAALYRRQGHGKYEITYSDADAGTIFVQPHGEEPPVLANAKVLDGLRMDRGTARQFRLDLQRDGEELTARAFENRLRRHDEQKAEPLTVRGRNEQARMQDRLAKARTATAPTMRTSAPGASAAAPAAIDPNLFQQGSGAAGRKRGER
jgi:hypothetical protein